MQVLTRSQRRQRQEASTRWPAVEVPRRLGPLTGKPRELFRFRGRPGGVAVGPGGTVFVSAVDSGTIWREGLDGTGTPHVDAGSSPTDSGREDRLLAPSGMAITADGRLIVADRHRHRICAVDPDGEIRVIAGGASGYRDGPAEQAMFRHPSDVAVGPDGNFYVADGGNDRIRAISPDGIVSTLAGSIFDFGDGQGCHGRFRRPSAIDVGVRGVLYVADCGNNAVRRVGLDGNVTTLAGRPAGGDRGRNGPAVSLRGPSGIAVAPDGTVWVADRDNCAVRRIASTGTMTTPLRLPARRWPSALAVGDDGSVIVAIDSLDEPFAPETLVLALLPDPLDRG